MSTRVLEARLPSACWRVRTARALIRACAERSYPNFERSCAGERGDEAGQRGDVEDLLELSGLIGVREL